MRRTIKDPFFYNTIARSDFTNAFIRAFTFRYDKYQEDYTDMLDIIDEGCYDGTKIGDFMCYYDEGDYFIHNMHNNVIVGWYKHLGRCNCVNIKGFTANDLYQFFKELRMACYKAGMYHVATPEWKAEQKAAKEAREARRNDPAYQEQLIQKVTMNSMYGVTCNPNPSDPIPMDKLTHNVNAAKLIQEIQELEKSPAVQEAINLNIKGIRKVRKGITDLTPADLYPNLFIKRKEENIK